MASTSETGHVKNIANFEDLISFCKGYGSIYNPSKISLSITELELAYDKSKQSHDLSAKSKVSFDMATDERQNAFQDLKSFSTRVINSLSVSGVDKLVVEDAKIANRKLQGSSRKKRNLSQEKLDTPVKTISNSQQSYDKQVDHFSNIVKVLEQNPTYAPNEVELQTTTLQAKLDGLKLTSSKVINSYTEYSNAMVKRNSILYNPISGLIQVSKEVKRYVKSVFGTTSQEYQQISGLEFKTLKRVNI